MANSYRVQVRVVAEFTYVVEVDAADEHEAENLAVQMDQDNLPDDFQVAKGYITDWDVETEQTGYGCEECGASGIADTHDEWISRDMMCAACFEKAEVTNGE